MKTLYELTQVISRFGTVIDFQRYSVIALGFTVQVEEKNAVDFYFQLQGMAEMYTYTNPISESSKYLLVLMNISFLSGTGNLEIRNTQLTD
jgi:hypothetical protein